MDTEKKNIPELIWDCGTAYDLFFSLMVLHNPTKFGLRGAWAAGVRSRLPQDIRDFLEDLIESEKMPFGFVQALPEPKDSSTLLYELKRIRPEDRLKSILTPELVQESVLVHFERAQVKGEWSEVDLDTIIKAIGDGKSTDNKSKIQHPQNIEKLLDLFVNAADFGNKYLEALEVYVKVFFAEEEKRISKRLETAVIEGKKLEENLSKKELLSKLSRGIEYETLPDAKQLVLAPSFWLSPFIITAPLGDSGKMLWAFGAREQGEVLVPGEAVPEDLTRMLKAIADPTRLRILRILMQEQTTPAELSRKLRLRAPTVTHHLHKLRLAGMVRFVMRGKQERIYFTNMDSVKSLYAQLKDFLEDDREDSEQPDRINNSRVV